jgi:nucleoside-diphosphate-sugar epimerase
VILGRHAQRLLQQLLRQPCYLRLPEPYPRLQCVHEDDVAQAVVQSLVRDARGAYNLAAPGDFSFRDVIRRSHRIGVALPVPLARAALSFAWRLTGWGGEPAWIDGLAATLTLDCTRARHDLGWQPVHDAAAMLFPGVRPSSPGTLQA